MRCGGKSKKALGYRAAGIFMSVQNVKVAQQLEKGKARETERTLNTISTVYQPLDSHHPHSRFLGTLLLRLHCVLAAAQRRPLVLGGDALPGLSDFQRGLLDWLRIDRGTEKPLSALSQIPINQLSFFLDEEEQKALKCVRFEERESKNAGAARSFLGSLLVEKGARESESDCESDNENSDKNASSSHFSDSAKLDREQGRDFMMESRKERKATHCPPCDFCGVESLKAKHCAGCKLAVYCSRECQKSHWKKGADFAEKAKNKALGPFPSVVPHKLSCPLLQQRVLPTLQSLSSQADVNPPNPSPAPATSRGAEAEGSALSSGHSRTAHLSAPTPFPPESDCTPLNGSPNPPPCPRPSPQSVDVSLSPQSARMFRPPLGETIN